MALMKWRELNQVKWVGVRPGHNGTQVLKENYVSNATLVLHTVTAGKTLYLCSAYASYYISATGIIGRLFVRDVADFTVYSFSICNSGALGQMESTPSYNPPIEIPAGYDICLISGAASMVIRAGIHGWEE